MSCWVKIAGLMGGKKQLFLPPGLKLSEVKKLLNIDHLDVYAICDGKLIEDDAFLHEWKIYHIAPRILGGKGGFGSMLRAIGAQIEKTTNREACRDLSGRRMRDVNNEKQLKEWIAKENERQQQKEEKRHERMARRRSMPQHKFDDPDYDGQCSKVSSDLQDALQRGLQKVQSSEDGASTSSASYKRKAETAKHGQSKKKCEWLGVDDLNSEESDSDYSDTNQHSPAHATVTQDEDGSCCNQEDDPLKTNCRKEATNTPSDSFSVPSNDNSRSSYQDDDKTTGTVPEDHKEVLPEGSSKDSTFTSTWVQSHSLLSSLPPPRKENESKTDEECLEPIDLELFSSAVELEKLGLNRLKTALMMHGMKCGGTLKERAQRLFSVKNLSPDQIDPSLLAKPSKGKK